MSLNLRYGLFALVVYLAFLVAGIPAQAYRWFAGASSPLHLYQPTGTLWQGRASMLELSGASFEDVDWRLRLLPLALGRIEFALQMSRGRGSVQGTLGRGLGGAVYARDLTLRMPVAEFSALIGHPVSDLKGNIDINLPRIGIRNHKLSEVAGTVQITDSGLGPPANVALGGFVLRLETGSNGMRGVLKDLGGPLQADGVVTVQPDGNYQFTGNLAVRDPSRADLAQALNFLGNPGPGGKVVINYNGKIPLDRL